ncbi:MAG: hypothetical protein AMS17_10200 [Spirochaetes bacterium DG_61]|nr:MAG: hypothetical protein AMS17_10200 [Spirochaetes bacterium DG_61]
MSRKRTGEIGENEVSHYLEKRGWKILERNFRFQRKEIDIIAKKGDIVAFIEVKRRKTGGFGKGMEAVDSLKQDNIIHVAKAYVQRNRLTSCRIRFDVASIDPDSFTYIEDAFQMQ